jgi:hypothetical protein
VIDVRSTFERRLTAAKTWDSICIYCLRTVSTEEYEGDLEFAEDHHICNEGIMRAVCEYFQFEQSETKH